MMERQVGNDAKEGGDEGGGGVSDSAGYLHGSPVWGNVDSS